MYSAFEKGAPVGLAISAALGSWILATDTFLWTARPEHAYGLLAFVVLDVVLATLILTRRKYAFLGTLVFATVQFLAQAGDPILGRPSGYTIETFALYLFSNWAFDALLIAQVAIMVLSWRGFVASRITAKLVR